MKITLSKALSLILAVILAFGAMIPAFASDEIPEGYTPIYTAEDLNNIRNNLSGSYILMNDIDLSEYNWVAIGTYEEPFTGTFDGNGHLIKNLNINCASADTPTVYCGLFGKISNATINNLNVYNADIKLKHSGEKQTESFVGIIAGYAYYSNIKDCVVSGNAVLEGFQGINLGGILGCSDYKTRTELCSNYSDVNAIIDSQTISVNIGGIVGVSSHIETKCANFGRVFVSGDNINEASIIKIGGISGKNEEGLFESNNYNRGEISTGFSVNTISIGGLSGNSVITASSYNAGPVLVAENFKGFSGALVGNAETPASSLGVLPSIEYSYYIDSDLLPAFVYGADPKDNYTYCLNNVQGFSDNEMKQQSSFIGFDFDTVWAMEEGGYPVLQNQPTLYGKESIELKKGETYAPKSFESWKSNDGAVATVNENGEIVALSAGTATVTIEHAYGFYTEYTVTVTDSTVTPDPDPTPDPEPPTDPEPTCWLIRILNFVKKTFWIIVDFVKILVP